MTPLLRGTDLFCGGGGFTTGVIDIGYRMLTPAELALAQGFPLGYYLHGTLADQVRQVGNSVSPPVAQAICTTLAEAA